MSEDKKNKSEIYHAHLHGLREEKYATLSETTVTDTEWEKITPKSPYYLFIPRNNEMEAEYETGWKVTEIFGENNVGIVTSRDSFAFDFNENEIKEKIKGFLDPSKSDDQVSSEYLKKRDKLDVSNARKRIRDDKSYEENFVQCLYRPFDTRWLFYHDAIIERSRKNTMRHLLEGENIGLITPRRVETKVGWTHVLCCSDIIEHVVVSGKTIDYLFPLYLYHEEHGETVKTANIAPEFIEAISQAVGYAPSPEEIFHYIYAVLHSRTYRTRYAEFLKIDFPRIPLPKSMAYFEKLGALGGELVKYHLLKKKDWGKLEQKGDATDTTVGKIHYDEKAREIILDSKKPAGEQVRIGPVDKEIWEFHIGGYQVPHKWLKDRKGIRIDIEEYAYILNALINTDRIMTAIDPIFEEKI